MTTNVKIAGTTFHPLPDGEYLRVGRTYEFEGTPCADTNAILMPEPTNQYDKDAVKVMVPLENGQAFHIGYLPKDSDLKRQIAQSGKTCLAIVMVKNFASKNPQYSPSWIITEVQGL